MRQHAIELFDRKQGEAANWQLIAETLFKAALDAIDLAPAGDRRTNVLNRVQAAAYDRIVGNVEPGTDLSGAAALPDLGHYAPSPDAPDGPPPSL